MTTLQVVPGMLRRVAAGDADALEELYHRYGGLVYRTAFGITRNPADADDVHQDVFLGLPAAIGKFGGHGSFEGWLRKVTVRTALMKLRKIRMRREVPLDKSAPVFAKEKETTVEDRLLLDEAIGTLSPEQRDVFLLRAVEGYTHREIGEMLGIKSLASRSRFHRAMERIVAFVRGAI